MKCLVTGCAGFIGSHLTDRLLSQGEQVIGIDNFTPYYDPEVKHRNLISCLNSPHFNLVEGDLTTVDLDAVLGDVEIIYHLAGQPGVRRSWGKEFGPYTINNVLATERLLHACIDRPIRRFVFAGSSSIYGDASDMPWRETTCPRPRSPYAITKLAAEHLCRAYHQDFAVPTVILRYFTVYGPRQRPDMAFHRFMRAAWLGRPIPLYGNGRQTRDFTYVSDIVNGTLAAGRVAGVEGNTYNLGGGSRIQLNDLLTLLGEIIGKPLRIEQQGDQAGDVRHTWADMTQASNHLAYSPQIPLHDGIRHEWEWFQDQIQPEAVPERKEDADGAS